MESVLLALLEEGRIESVKPQSVSTRIFDTPENFGFDSSVRPKEGGVPWAAEPG